MKNLVKSALVAACVLVLGSYAKAQQKIGYVNFQGIVSGTKDFADVQTNINIYQKQFIDQQQGIQTELQTKGAEYEKNRNNMNDAARLKAESELQDINKRLQDFNTNAQNQVQAKYSEMIKPLVDKVKAAVSQVAKEKGYAYVIDTSQTELLVAPEADNLEAAVKAKAGLTAAPATTAPGRK